MAISKITTNSITDDAVTTAKVNADAIGTTELANDVAISTSGATALTNKLTVLAADGTVDNDWVMDVRNDEATDDRSYGLRVSAGSTVTDRALDVLDHAQANTLLRVNGSGHLSLPQQPMFRGKDFSAGVATNGTTGYNASNSHYKPLSVELNIGSHFDNTNGIFTVPTDGVYFCHITWARTSDNWVGVQLVKNTTTIRAMWMAVSSRTSANWDTRDMICLVSASANDKLYFTYANGYTAPANNNNTDMNIFKVA